MFPALVVAANRGSAQMVALLLEHKADPNPSRGYPVMFLAGVQTGAVARCNPSPFPIVNGFIDVVTLLLDSNADVSAATAQGNTPLHYAAAGGHAECCGAILSCGADSNVPLSP
ncbi:ankyrin repeat-containing domain protein [Baffinella frigidus]|nr:ankyrin repeat-containing domain protein [Cryptophyta sp. CCMP2293]